MRAQHALDVGSPISPPDDKYVKYSRDPKRGIFHHILPHTLRQKLVALSIFVAVVVGCYIVYFRSEQWHQYYKKQNGRILMNSRYTLHWDKQVVDARLLLTPLHGAWNIWRFVPPFYPFGCMMAHPHVIVTFAERCLPYAACSWWCAYGSAAHPPQIRMWYRCLGGNDILVWL